MNDMPDSRTTYAIVPQKPVASIRAAAKNWKQENNRPAEMVVMSPGLMHKIGPRPTLFGLTVKVDKDLNDNVVEIGVAI